MYCRSRVSDPFSNLNHLVNSKLSRFGLVRASVLGYSPRLFNCWKSGVLLSKYASLSENSAGGCRASANSIGPAKRLNSRSFSAMGVADEAGLARRLWAKFKKDTALAQYNSFVVALAAGTLKMESFKQYMTQDAYFLKAFAQAYEMAEDCADDDDDKSSISELRKATEEELNLHNSLAEDCDVEFAKECSPNTATVKYTEFLLATAAGKVEGGKGASRSVTPFEKTKIAAYTVGAMTPCMRLYAFLGQEIAKALEPDCSNHPYKQWIETYSSAKFEASALQTEELLDKLAISLTGEELEVLGRLYHHALKLERDFFSAQPLSQRTLVPLLKPGDSASRRFTIVSDFDLSCTLLDSSAVLAEIAILTTLKTEQNGAENPSDRKSSSELRNTWDALSSQYSKEFEECLRKILPPEEVDIFDYEGLHQSLEQLSQFEMEANSKVVQSGVLEGINIDDIKKAGERLAFQDGCANFFEQILTKMDDLNVGVHIISVCWSGDIIRAAFSSSGLDGLQIHSNELTFVESVSTGGIDRRVESPVDKLKIFNNICSSKDQDTELISIYIGDSLGDLLCLLQADIGIVIGKSLTLRSVGKRFGISFVPLFTGLLKQESANVEGSISWTKQSGILYTVSSWSELHAFILGSSN